MAEKRFALIIASSQYADPDLQKLIAPAQDAEALANILKDPNIGSFDVKTLLDEPSYKVNEEIQAFFSDRGREDLLLLYFSCHGIKDEEGQLYFATSNTSRKLLDATAISANFVNRMMFRSRSRRQLLLLDCCYSGAFAKGLVSRADKKIHTGDYFEEGRGRIVLTASDSMQYSFEADTLNVEVKDPGSIFTRAIIEGLNTGKADLDKDGRISYDELYDYTYDRVIDETPLQKPGKWVFGVEGDVIVARNPNWKEVNVGPVKTAEEFAATKPEDVVSSKPQTPPSTAAPSQQSPQPTITNKALLSEGKSTPRTLRPIKDINPTTTTATGHPTIIKKDSTLLQPSQSSDSKPSFAEEKTTKTENTESEIEEANNKFQAGGLSFTKDDASVSERNSSSGRSSSPHPIHEKKSLLSNPTVLLPILGGGIIGGIIIALVAGGIIHFPGGGGGNVPPSTPATPVQPPPPPTSVLAPNRLPVANAGTDQTVDAGDTVTLDGAKSADPDGNIRSYSWLQTVGPPVTLNGANTATPSFVAPSDISSDTLRTFKLTVTDNAGANNTASVNITVKHVTPIIPPALPTPVDHPPTATDQSVTTNLNTPADITLAGSDQDQNDTLTAHIVTPPLHGTLGTINQDTGVVTYTPNQGFTGDDSFTFKINDGKADSSNTAKVSITVNNSPANNGNSAASNQTQQISSSNTAPTATDQSVTTNLNTPVDITLAGSDPNQNDTLTAAIVTNPSHGTLGDINQATGVVTYTPNQGFTGDDSFTFKINDGKADSSNIGTVNIRVGGG
jgi:hypothetical protein